MFLDFSYRASPDVRFIELYFKKGLMKTKTKNKNVNMASNPCKYSLFSVSGKSFFV